MNLMRWVKSLSWTVPFLALLVGWVSCVNELSSYHIIEQVNRIKVNKSLDAHDTIIELIISGLHLFVPVSRLIVSHLYLIFEGKERDIDKCWKGIHIKLMYLYFLHYFQEDQDWGIVAMVLDRMFLWVFGAAAVVGSFMILTESPSLFDPIQPIDSLITTIGVDTPPPQS